MGSVRRLGSRGTLFLDFRYRGKRCREYRALPDTEPNRRRLSRVLARIEQQIADGTFDYAAFFQKNSPAMRSDSGADAPSRASASASVLPAIQDPGPTAPAAECPTFRDFTEQWLRERAVEWRRSHLRTLRSTIDRHLLPRFGERRLHEITKADIFALRAELAKLPGRSNRHAMSNKRINGIIGPLKQILNEAAER